MVNHSLAEKHFKVREKPTWLPISSKIMFNQLTPVLLHTKHIQNCESRKTRAGFDHFNCQHKIEKIIKLDAPLCQNGQIQFHDNEELGGFAS